MLPEKSSLNVNFVCPICSDCPDDGDDHGNIDDQTGVYSPYSLNQTVSAGSYRTKRARTAALNRGDCFELRTP